MKNKNKYILISAILIFATGFFAVGKNTVFSSNTQNKNPTTTSSVKFVDSTISANGSVTAKNQARLTFQIPGKLVYLPFKEGDVVKQGDVVARLDTSSLYYTSVSAEEAYKTALAAKDSAVEARNQWMKINQDKEFTDIVRAERGQVDAAVRGATASAEAAKASMDAAQSALSNATLITPISGVLTHKDVNVTGVNIAPTTSFTVSDPDSIVFRANIPVNSIYYVSPGADATLVIDGYPERIEGKVSEVYPSKVSLGNGQFVYQVDIVSQNLSINAKFDQTGTAIINTNAENVALVPAWTVLNGNSIWVEVDGTPQLKEVETGKVHGSEIEIISGLSAEDKIIVDPKYIANLNYKLL